MDDIEKIKAIITDNPVVLFMKGTPDFPQCGFSMRTAEALKACNARFTYVDVLAAPDVRANLPKISNWPTFPQVFINGELIGGCDITLELYQKGELQQMLDAATSRV
jgi:monothiol glutaredoxin